MPAIIFFYIKDTCHQLPLEPDTTVTIGSGKRDTLSIPESGMAEEQFSFTVRNNKIMLSAKAGVFAKGAEVAGAEVSIGDAFACGEVAVYICPKQSDYDHAVQLSADREYVVGRSRTCTFCLSNQYVGSRHAKITFESGKYKLTDLESKNHTFVNGRRISTCYLKDGDQILIGYYGMAYEQGELAFFNTGTDFRLNLDERAIVCRYPYFRRSPRLEPSFDAEPVEVQAPPNIWEKPQINWFTVFFPPFVMAGVSVASVFLNKGNLAATLLYLLPMTFVTLLTTIVAYTSQMRKYRREKRKKEVGYEQYMERICSKADKAYQQQRFAVNRANPETSYCYDIVSERMRRLWERTAKDEDFLEVRLGRGTLPLRTEFRLPQTGIGEEVHPEFLKLKHFLETMRNVEGIAVTLPLKKAGIVGIVGNRQVGIKTVQNAVVQMTTHQSYGDLKLVVVADERSYEDWSFARWLPHTWRSNRQFRFVSSSKKQAAELLEYFEGVLKARRNAPSREGGQGNILLPHFVFVITDSALTEGREFLRLLADFGLDAGMSAFLLFDTLNKLPKECDWLVEVNNSGGSVYEKGNGERRKFTLDAFEEYGKFARAMAPIRDRDADQDRHLPSSVSFFQGYQIADAAELHLLQRWADAKPYQTLAAPIGVKENESPFLFDIHEKAHGPHGLVAGTTGAGKSEVLQTYILSMCVNFSPQDVSFVLVDFKGSGLAGSLKGLPHIAGVITDMDENIQRNLFSLDAEMERRKKLFANVSNEERKIQDIYEYQKEYYSGNLSEPLSHLIVVIDEFTELKSRFPDFMAAVERASRVGRTLGIHLILATQKPGGSVSDEIRANSNFKWCLRVKEGESREVLGRADAESIPQEYPGRAYIQVGNNEIFELVQIYYSGADIAREGEERTAQIAFVNPMGHRETLKNRHTNGQTVQGKELLALVKHISSWSVGAGKSAARKIWADSLPKCLALSEISDTKTESLLSAVIGLADDPRHQKQYPYEIDFEQGHVIVYGAAGTGKTTLLQTLVMSLAERYTPEEVHIYIMDFGSWSMKNLHVLPHVGDVANGNEKEKLMKLVKMLAEELDRRKLLFAGSGAGNLRAYRQVSAGALPSILTVIDNFAPIREGYPEMEDALIRLSREGGGFGMFFVVTASALSGNIGYHVSQNFRQALALQMVEKADYRDIVGDTEGLEPLRTAGRGLIRGKPPVEFQTALAVSAEDMTEYFFKLKSRCEQIASEWSGSVPRRIPIMPDIVVFEDIKDAQTEGIVLGLSEDAVTLVIIPQDNRLMLISGTEGSGKTNMLGVIVRQLQNMSKVVEVSASADPNGGEKIAQAVRLAEKGEELVLVIDDISEWLSEADYEVMDALEELIKNQKNNAFSLYAAGNAADLAQESSGILSRMSQLGRVLLLGGSFSEHSSRFEANNIGYSQQAEVLLPNYGYLIWRKKAVLFKALFRR